MKRVIGYLLGMMLIFFANSTYAAEINQGYTTVEQAVKQFEEKHGQGIKAPTFLPLQYSQQKGRVYDSDAKLELEYTHQSETLIVFVSPNKEPLRTSEFHETVLLKDGTKAYYRVSTPGFHQLDFTKGNLNYKIWASSKSKYVTSSKELVRVANSII
ncbi:hypothetical protein CBW65_14725 [Tumebacillus avium]|uniref:DUF4367 domain-containing protein n=1 Tax=Tumebacillus avium TaxID=1903704 RepID=A0A1Y0ING1_9BACL|nr:hypothetical protein [Tumebacillus avium]ARU62112.1 hypothetical protein CBW65_14725 [Tumebacillus avium]